MAAQTRPVLALDIGGTKLAVGVVTDDGQTFGYRVEPTRREDGPDAIIARLLRMGHEAINEAGLGPIAAVGVSSGGPLDAHQGVILGPLNLPEWTYVPITDIVSAEYGVPAVLENDATAAMLGEFRYGAARGAEIALYLTLSTGVGGGAIVHGALHRGAAGNGGEFGHLMVRPGGRRCTCGRLGCLEGYASGTSIAVRAREAVSAAHAPSVLDALETIRAEDVVGAVLVGDHVATEIWDETTAIVGQAVTDLVNLFEPEVIVLGGGVTHAGDLLLDPVLRAVARDAMPPAAAAVRIEFAALGDAVCVVGAAARAFDRVNETQETTHA